MFVKSMKQNLNCSLKWPVKWGLNYHWQSVNLCPRLLPHFQCESFVYPVRYKKFRYMNCLRVYFCVNMKTSKVSILNRRIYYADISRILPSLNIGNVFYLSIFQFTKAHVLKYLNTECHVFFRTVKVTPLWYPKEMISKFYIPQVIEIAN